MKNNIINIKPDDEKEYIPSTIYISLYLFLIIFFILMNSSSISSNSDKKSVSEIKKVFSPQIFVQEFVNSNKNFVDPSLKDLMKELYKEQIHSIFGSDFTPLPLDKNNHNNFAKFSISTTSIFYPDSDQIKKEHEKIFAIVSNLINDRINKSNIRVEITIGALIDESLHIEKNNPNLIDKRVLSIYKNLILNNANQNNFLLGISKTEAKSVIFSFYLNE